MNEFLEKLSIEQRTKLALCFFVTLIVILIVTALATTDKALDEKYKQIYEYGGDFTLQSYHGNVSLQDYQGKVVIVYFGFLKCTEACPISMATVVGAINHLTREERDKLQVFFVSVDPERDNQKSLKAWTQHYEDYFSDDINPSIITAISSDQKTIDKVTKDYGVFFDLVDLEGSALNYTVDHSSRFYMVGTDGKLVTTMNHSTTPIELAAKIQELQNVKGVESSL